jgi:hypothetical protein
VEEQYGQNAMRDYLHGPVGLVRWQTGGQRPGGIPFGEQWRRYWGQAPSEEDLRRREALAYYQLSGRVPYAAQ